MLRSAARESGREPYLPDGIRRQVDASNVGGAGQSYPLLGLPQRASRPEGGQAPKHAPRSVESTATMWASSSDCCSVVSFMNAIFDPSGDQTGDPVSRRILVTSLELLRVLGHEFLGPATRGVSTGQHSFSACAIRRTSASAAVALGRLPELPRQSTTRLEAMRLTNKR